MKYVLYPNLISAYDATVGAATFPIPDVVANYPDHAYLYKYIDLDAADGDLLLQGSVDGNSWATIDTATLSSAPAAVNVVDFTSTTQFIVDSDISAALTNSPLFLLAGNTTPGNNGLFEATAFTGYGRITISNEVGAGFDVGETITGSISTATAEVIVVNAAYLVYELLSPVDFSALDSITGGTSLTTADVDVVGTATIITVSGGLTVEAGAGTLDVASTTTVNFTTPNTNYSFYRFSFVPNSVTAGYIYAEGVVKNYFE